MLRNYFKIAWRNLSRQKSNTIINILGLATGLACCILIALFIREELAYDQFHENSDRIITLGVTFANNRTTLSTPYPLADALESEVLEVTLATRLKSAGTVNLSTNGKDFTEVDNAQYAETDLFNVFSFELLSGNEKEVLNSPNEIVLTQKLSKQLFGTENPIGESIYWMQRDTLLLLQVSGVIKSPPYNSSIQFGSLISYSTYPERYRRPDSWRSYSHQTYALLNQVDVIEGTPSGLDLLVGKYYDNAGIRFEAIPLTSLHLSPLSGNAGFSGDWKFLYLFGSIALFILLIACVNYVNLSTARVSLRAKEVGIRKTTGAGRGQLAFQFLCESVLLTVIAYLIAITLVELSALRFDLLFGTNLAESDKYIFYVWMGFSALGIGLLTGSYPALYLSSFSPVFILRSTNQSIGSGTMLRKALVIGQFSIASILIIGSIVVYKQLQFTQDKELGFDGEQVVILDLPNNTAWESRYTLQNNVVSHSGILGASIADGAPSKFNIRLGYSPESLSSEIRTKSEEDINIAPAVVDYDFIEVLDIQLLAGRNFSSDYASDLDRAYVINRKTAELLGWTPEEAIGKMFTLGKEGEVIGVIENFHITSLHAEIEPVVLQLHEADNWSNKGLLIARLHPDKIAGAMDFLEKELAKFSPYQIFNFEFLDDNFDAMYRTEQQLAQIVTFFTFIAIFIACLGLYGLVTFATERRFKEIGIRKVMGATVSSIVTLLSKDFMKLVIIGFIIAVPIAWYAMNYWLADFAYRIVISPDIFVLAGSAASIIALLTVSRQAVKAAIANPVKSLRSE